MSLYLTRADWSFPIPIWYGPGRLAEVGAYCRGANRRCALLVTDRNSRDLPFINGAQSALARAGVGCDVFSEVSPNPTGRDIAEGCEAFQSGDYDAVIAIGGGSGMDAGKAISLVARNRRDIMAFDYDRGPPDDLTAADFAPLICIPTTAGTGAETESTAMLTDVERAVKVCVWHPLHKPELAILDPELTVGLPRNLTAWTGIDALVHAMEALSVPAWHPLCDGLSIEAMRLIYRWLPLAVEDGENLEARGAMLTGSCLAGVSFLKGLGLVHAMSHMVGAVCGTHHGLTNAILLPPVLRYNRRALAQFERGEKIAVMARAMALPREDFDALYAAVVDLLDRFEIPRGLGAIGVTAEQLPDIAQKACTDAAHATNPAASTAAEVEQLLTQSLTQAR